MVPIFRSISSHKLALKAIGSETRDELSPRRAISDKKRTNPSSKKKGKLEYYIYMYRLASERWLKWKNRRKRILFNIRMHVMEVHAYHGLRSSLRAFYRAHSRSSRMVYHASLLPPLAASLLRLVYKMRVRGNEGGNETRVAANYMKSD